MNTIIGIDSSASYRVYAAVSSEPVAAAEAVHKSCSPAFGMVLTVAGLMGLMLKGKRDKLSLIFKNKEANAEILATANADGKIKGYISSDDIALKGGSLTVIKDLGLKEPYIGRTELESGDISKDMAKYFAVSEQQPSAVLLAPNGGLIIQALPGAQDEVIEKLEDRLFMMDSLLLLIEDAGGDIDKLVSIIFGEELKLLDRRNISWECDCGKEKMAAALISVGKKDLAAMIEEDGEAELTCQFCRRSYKFSKEELTEILRNA